MCGVFRSHGTTTTTAATTDFANSAQGAGENPSYGAGHDIYIYSKDSGNPHGAVGYPSAGVYTIAQTIIYIAVTLHYDMIINSPAG